MKKKVITFLFISFILSGSFQALAGTYEEVMKTNIDKMYKVKTAEELTAISGVFYRVAEKENDKWLPLYYASYSLVRIAFYIKDGDEIDKHLDVAQQYLDKLLKDKNDVCEVHVLQGLLYSMRITNPSRGMKYSMLSNKSLDKAKEINDKNPRMYHCMANNVFHTPSMFGGGKKKAKPIFEKAAELFKTESSDVAFWPSWGEWHNNEMLAKCNDE